MMRFFPLAFLFRTPRRSPVIRRDAGNRLRPRFDELEARAVPALYSVVPAGQENNTTTFATLAAALAVPTLATGDTIQIEAGSTPGDVASNPTTEGSLTIQSNPALAIGDVPAFTISGTFTIQASQAVFTLQNLNFSIVGAGSVAALAHTQILRCHIASTSTQATSIQLLGNDNLVSGNQLTANSTSISELVDLQPAIGSPNQVLGNTFIATQLAPGGALLEYSPSVLLTTAAGDVYSNNQFLGGGAINYTMFNIDATAATLFNFLTVQGNIFQDLGASSDVQAITVGTTVQNVSLVGNRITLNRGSGIVLDGPSTTDGAATYSVSVNGNTISTPTGVGIEILPAATAAAQMVVAVLGNTFTNSLTGVLIDRTGRAGTFAGFDLGNSGTVSVPTGGNDFRSFTTAATLNTGAIVVTSAGQPAQTLLAQANIFATGINPANVVFPDTDAINTANDLTGNQAFVLALYSQVLQRAGNLNSSTDAGGWVSAMNGVFGASRNSVASSIIRSAEALTKLVNPLYPEILGRAPDSGGVAGWVNFMQTGGTYEQVIVNILSSPEYAARNGSPSNQIQQLYLSLLGRLPSQSEIDGWLGVFQTSGLVGVANGFVYSAEFRTLAVNQLYGATAPVNNSANFFALPNLLHRGASSPAPIEINPWVNSGIDLLSIEVLFAGSVEYFRNG